MVRFIFHSIFLTLSILLTFFWTKDPNLSTLNLQLVGLIILFYFATKLFSGTRRVVMALDAIIFTVVTILVVQSTGGLTSPVFFLLYFLLFSLSLLFEPYQSIIVSSLISLFYILETSFRLETSSLVNLTTLILITPLAIVFGRKYLETMQAGGKIKLLSETIAVEETDTLIWLSTKAKPTLANFLDTTSQIIASNLLPFRLQEKLKDLHTNLISLHQSANDLEKDIDEQTDY